MRQPAAARRMRGATAKPSRGPINIRADVASASQARTVSALRLRIRDGLTIAVPPTLSAITTYVLLEQEDWFEKEVNFLRRFIRPGMTAIDIGANLGVYSLPLARLVGPSGHVFSYEPGRDARALLTHSRDLNGLGNLDIIDAALSDRDRDGVLAFAASSELRALGAAGAGEPVRITSLDAEAAVRRWAPPDFVKIDAEGEEERIISGGRAFFATHSPLVMFEIKAGDTVNERLLEVFPPIGYRLFRQLAGAPMLVPHDATQRDGSELNLFAAKSDRVRTLAQQGLLADTIPAWAPSDDDRTAALAFWQGRTFASAAAMAGIDGLSANSDYHNGLVAYAAWRDSTRPAATRCAALAVALTSVRAACARVRSVARASTWARVAWESGARHESVVACRVVLQSLQGTTLALSEQFWPASPRFDDVAPGTQLPGWFAAAAAEQLERSARFLVDLRRRLADPGLALRATVRERGDGTPADPGGGARPACGRRCRNGYAPRHRTI